MKKCCYILVLILLTVPYSRSQEKEKSNEEMSIFEFFISKKKKAEKKDKPVKQKKVYISAIPVISSNPVVGVAYGGVVNGAFVIGGDYKTTRFSAITLSGVYTTNEQSTLAIKNFLYFKDEKWILQGSLNWRIFPMFTWGVGSDTPDKWASQLENNGFSIDQMLLKKVGDNWFFGGGININYVYEQSDNNVQHAVDYIGSNRNQDAVQFWNSVDKTLPFVIKDSQIPGSFVSDWGSQSSEAIQAKYFKTPFQLYPYGTGKSVFTNGLKVGVTHDSRDNINTPRKGAYFNFNYNLYIKNFGNDENFGVGKIDYRQYFMLGSYKNVIGVRSYMVFMAGNGPYINMPANNTDPNSTGTRGIPGFRYRGDNYVSAEVEYRRHIWKFINGVVFVNAHSLSEKKEYLMAMGEPLKYDGKFRFVNPGYGLGLRFILSEKSRTTLSFDYAWNKYSFTTSKDSKRGEFYMSMNAAF
ncbi:Surface antigen [compost metagenome]